MTQDEADDFVDSVLRRVAAAPAQRPPDRCVTVLLGRAPEGRALLDRARELDVELGAETDALPDGTVRLVWVRARAGAGDAALAAEGALSLLAASPSATVAFVTVERGRIPSVATETAVARAREILALRTGPGVFVDAASAPALAASYELEGSDPLRLLSRREGVRAPSPLKTLRRGASVGRFVLLEAIGEGGSAVVWAAYDPHLERKIALKFLRAPQASLAEPLADGDLARLRREAQALARVNHPNVVTIHDVGAAEGFLYIAEEFVPRTLLDYLEERPQRVDDVVAIFVQAGEGLAAAHHAGLVHRDFKPANVLLGADGRARVADFGLVRLAAPDAGAEGPPPPTGLRQPDARETAPVDAAPHASLTHTGALVGTPAYMSPEQHEGSASDARSDQFAFCVSLYAALYGELPFVGATSGERLREINAGRIREAPRGSRVPSWVRTVVLRGLRPSPADRHPSMDALLGALRRDPRRALGRKLAGATAVAALLAAAILGLRTSQARSQLCTGAERKLAGVWDPGRRADGQRAFRDSKLPFAEDAWHEVDRLLGDYAARWVSMHTETCEATRLRGEQSEEVLDLRMGCLSERLEELRATAEIFANADPPVVRRGVQAAGGLDPISDCADVESLRAPLRMPRDAATSEKVQQTREKLAQAKALDGAGRYKAALVEADAALRAARTLGYRPLVAEALGQVGRTQVTVTGGLEAEATLVEAFETALACRHVEVAAHAATRLVVLLGFRLPRQPEAFRWARLAQAELEALGGNREVEAMLATNLGLTYHSLGKYEEALAQHRRALAIRVADLGSDDVRVGMVHNNIGIDLSGEGDYDAALEQYRAALAIKERRLGPEHPDTAKTLTNIGVALEEQGKTEAALAAYGRALSINESVFGSDNRAVAEVLTDMGDAYRIHGSFDDALTQYERALAIQEKALGPDHEDVSWTLGGMGAAKLSLGDFAEATRLLERAVAISDKSDTGPDVAAEQRFALSRALWDGGGERRRAVELARKARDLYAGLTARRKELATVDAWLGTHARS